MKVLEVEFTWQVPYVGKDGKGNHKRIFRAPEHRMEWAPASGVLVIDGRCVSPFQAVWTLDEFQEVWDAKDPNGRDQPSGAAGPARGAKQRR